MIQKCAQKEKNCYFISTGPGWVILLGKVLDSQMLILGLIPSSVGHHIYSIDLHLISVLVSCRLGSWWRKNVVKLICSSCTIRSFGFFQCYCWKIALLLACTSIVLLSMLLFLPLKHVSRCQCC